MTAIWFHTEILSGGLGGVIRTTGSLGGCASCIIKQLSGFFYMYMYNTLFDFAGTFTTTDYIYATVTCTLMLAQIMPVNKTPFHACKNGSEENSVITCLHAHGLNFYYNLLQEGVDKLVVGVQEAVEASLEALEHHGEQEGIPGPVPQ